MTVYIVTNEPFPNGMAATHRIICYAKSLSLKGDKVEVIVYHRTEVYGNPPKNIKGEGYFDNFHFRYIGGTPLRAKFFFVRRWNDIKDKHHTVEYLKRCLTSGDAILLYCGDESELTPKLIRIAKQHRCSIVRDLCEFPFGTRNDNKKNENKRKIYLETIFPELDGAICISEALYKLAQKHHPTGNHIKIPILVETNDDKRIHYHPRPYIFHGGTMYERKDAIVSTMKAFAIACQKLNYQIDFILAGPPSPHRAELDSIIQEYNINSNVTFLPQLTQNVIAAYQRGAFLPNWEKY